MSFDFQESGEHYASSVMDEFYRGRASGGFFDSTCSDGAASSQSSSSRRASPRRATSPMSFSSFGPRSPLATMFAFDPLDDVPEGVATRSDGRFDAALDDDDDEEEETDRDSAARFFPRTSLRGLSDLEQLSQAPASLATSPALLQTLSPPVTTGRYIPPFLRNRMNNSAATGVFPPDESDASNGYAASPAAEPLPAPAPGRWIPPNQREGFVSSTSRLSIDTYSASAMPTTRESFSDNFVFEESDSYSLGDDVHGVTSLIGVRKAMEDVCCCIPDLNAHFSDTTSEQKQSIYVLFDGHSGVRVRPLTLARFATGSITRRLSCLRLVCVTRRPSSRSNASCRTCARTSSSSRTRAWRSKSVSR